MAALLPRAQQSLQSTIEVHQTLAVLNVLGHAAPALVGTRHIAALLELLQLCLPGIDANDMAKTNNSLRFYGAVLSFATLGTLQVGLCPQKSKAPR